MIHLPPLKHRLLAWGMNLALSVWVLEALGVFAAVVLIARGGERADWATRIVGAHSLALLVAQGVATIVALLCSLGRHALRAETMAPIEQAWMTPILFLMLTGSTAYILFVGARDFQLNRIIVSHTVKVVQQVGKADEMEVRYQETQDGPAKVRQDFKEASAELSIVCSLGAFSAAGLLVLHVLGWRGERARGRGRRRGRVPPWREPRTDP